jgi:aryl-alcohol dehydrogenase-like predicted oxidoreductase
MTLHAYNPDRAPDVEEWLALDEQHRIGLVETFHRRARVKLPNIRAHAAFHAIVENQIAMQHPPVVRAMARLLKQGLSRHDGVHAIGSVLVHHFHELLTTGCGDLPAVVQARYDAAVERLTADGWLAQAEE